MKIIIVDDDKIIRMGLNKILNKLFDNHEVVADFQNGQLALDYLRQNKGKIDLVITDMKMPVMTGNELIKIAINEFKFPPTFVVLSGYDEFTYVRDTMKYGAFNYLLKPIKKDELKKLIEEVENKRAEMHNKNKLINKSTEVIRKEFFKQLLFSNKIDKNKINKDFLSNIQLNDKYYFKMIVLPLNKERKDISSKLISEYVKSVLMDKDYLEYLYFNCDDNGFIMFYFNINECESIDNLQKEIEDKTQLFTDNFINVYIFDCTNVVWELKEYSGIIAKLGESMTYSKSAKKYYTKDLKELAEILSDDNNENNAASIKLAIKYITNNYNKNITLKDVADEVFLSQNYLSELFKKETGVGFYEFLSTYRVRKAKEMLKTTNLKIYEVAENVGYNDSITFGRAFKKLTGTTPNNFRNNKLKV